MALVINGETVDSRTIDAEAEALRQRFEQLDDRQRAQYGLERGSLRSVALRWARENVIEQVLLRQQAEAVRPTVDPDEVDKAVASLVKAQGGPGKLEEQGTTREILREMVQTRMRVDALVASVGKGAPQPRQKQVAEYYRRNKDRFRTEEQVRAAHIVKHVGEGVSEDDAREAALQLLARLRDGASFAELADRHSDCPGGGGDLGFFPRGKMVPDFDEAVFDLQEGETTGVFQTVFGFHIARMLERSPARLRSFAEVRDEIRTHLHQQRATEVLERYVDRLREKAVIRDVPDQSA